MKAFIHACPLIVLTILSALAVACAFGVRQVMALQSSVAEAGTSTSSMPAPSSSIPSSSKPQPSSAPPSSTVSSRKPVSSAQVASSRPASVAPSYSRAPQPKQPLFHSVKQDYFDDALFVGDSLTEDLGKYGGLDNASYFDHVGLSIYQLFEHPKADASTGQTFESKLNNHRYRKIYIMLGINEMGTGSTSYFVRHYSAALTQIQKLQPHAILYIESILPVTAEKSESDSTFNNQRIRERNAGLQKLANGKNIFYLDVSSALEDDSGNLPQEYSGDDVHLRAKYYPLWKNYLLKNAVPYSDASFS